MANRDCAEYELLGLGEMDRWWIRDMGRPGGNEGLKGKRNW